MLLEFSCSNHKSIKDKIIFSMIAGSDNTFEEYLKVYDSFKVLRSAAIYGANGSGKSNFLSALAFVSNLVATSISNQPGQGVFQARHKLSKPDSPSEYAIQFIHDEIRYAYGFSIVQNRIDMEYLYYFPKGRQVKIFERNGMSIKPGDRYKSVFELSTTILKDNRLFLSCAANYSNVKEIESAFFFFTKEVVIYNPTINNWTEYSISLMQKNNQIKDLFLNILQSLGTGIKDVKVRLDKVNLSEFSQEKLIPESIRNLIGNNDLNKVEAKVIYNDFEVDLMSEESEGIKRLFQMICPIIDILESGKILVCDEIESSLHESVVSQIIQLFLNYRKDNFAQLIFSTHDTSLLDSNLFRRDQIWFTQLRKDRSTDLYSLAEIRNVRKSENLANGYISGKYGAIPMLNRAFFESLEY